MERNSIKKYITVIFGLILSAVSFDLFLSPIKIVVGGTNGLSILVGEILNINPSSLLTFFYVLMIFVNFIFYGLNDTKKLLFCSLLYPIFVNVFECLPNIIVLNYSNKLLHYLMFGILYGIGCGLTFREGYLGGGLDVLKKIISDKLKIPMGKAIFMVDAVLIISGGFIFGLKSIMYAIIILYISSNVTDRIILGVSNKKMFYIMTKKPDVVRKYIQEELHSGVTQIEAVGGYKETKYHVLMTVISTHDYVKLKKFINEIDKHAFYIITDSYYTYSGRCVKYGVNSNKRLRKKV